MKTLLAFTFFCMSLFGLSQTDSLHYEFIVSNKKIGDYYIYKTSKKQQTHYHAITDVQVEFVLKYNFYQTLDVYFSQGKLDSSKVYFYKNKDLRHKTITHLKDTGLYEVFKNDLYWTLHQAIAISSICLYFEEPKNFKYAFSERDGSIKKVSFREENGYNIYLVQFDKKDTPSYFYYRNGKLEKVVVDYPLLNFEIRPSKL